MEDHHINKLVKASMYALACVCMTCAVLVLIWVQRPDCKNCNSKTDVRAAYHRDVDLSKCPSGVDPFNWFEVGPFTVRGDDATSFPGPSKRISLGWSCVHCRKDIN